MVEREKTDKINLINVYLNQFRLFRVYAMSHVVHVTRDLL